MSNRIQKIAILGIVVASSLGIAIQYIQPQSRSFAPVETSDDVRCSELNSELEFVEGCIGYLEGAHSNENACTPARDIEINEISDINAAWTLNREIAQEVWDLNCFGERSQMARPEDWKVEDK